MPGLRKAEQGPRHRGKVFLADWRTLAHACGLVPLTKFAATLQAHAQGILNWWRARISNGLIEGMNSLIQTAIAKARGYRNPGNLITMAYLIADKLSFFNVPTLAGLPT